MILDWVKSGLLFGIFGSLILMLTPNKSYQKHISFVVGLLFILVMLHPLMELLSLDSRTYFRSIENYFSLESGSINPSENDLRLYSQTLEVQLKAVLIDSGYEIEKITVQMNGLGDVTGIIISFKGGVTDLSSLEAYIHNLFGQEVTIRYETE